MWEKGCGFERYRISHEPIDGWHSLKGLNGLQKHHLINHLSFFSFGAQILITLTGLLNSC